MGAAIFALRKAAKIQMTKIASLSPEIYEPNRTELGVTSCVCDRAMATKLLAVVFNGADTLAAKSRVFNPSIFWWISARVPRRRATTSSGVA
jgi:hypothetical protein